MASRSFNSSSFFLRFFLALVVVFCTYNPEGLSYYHWALTDLDTISILKAFLGVVLLIGWVILIRATISSLGIIGVVLAGAFFGLLIWLLVDLVGLDAANIKVMSYIVEVVLMGILSAGVSWSHIRRRVSGQIDIDDVED
ncbi:MAG: DUF6524 family protein [Sedimenticola sp.]